MHRYFGPVLRAAVLSFFFFLLLQGSQASCVLVQRQDGRSAAGLVVRCAQGHVLGTVDAMGLLCPTTACDTVVLTAIGLRPLRLAWSDALRTGRIQLVPEIADLPALTITPWPARADRQALAAQTTPDSLLLAGFERSSIRSTLLWIPGVQMDQRGHGGSTRLSIRGSLLRAPYGVRGVKVYWGPFTLTRADGSTPLELLDPELVGTLDVVRSVGGPLYGSAPAGLVLSDAPWRRTPGTSARISLVGGSYGYSKLSVGAQLRGNDGAALSVGLLRLRSDGYRAQESARRDQVFLSSRWNRKRSITRAYLTWQRSAWELPGSVDAVTAEHAPRAARPYSEAIDAHIEKAQLFAGLAYETDVRRGMVLRSMVQASTIDKSNPYGTTPAASGDKEEESRTVGARLALGGQYRTDRTAFFWETGLEALMDQDDLLEWSYANGIRGDRRTDARARVRNLNGFIITRTRIGPSTTVFAELGLERTAFEWQDGLRNNTLNTAPPMRTYPLFGLSRRISAQWSAQVRYAESLSRPTVWEMLGTTGLVNTGLQPEAVKEWEVGLVKEEGRWRLTLNSYLRNTEGLILSRTDTAHRETFHNAGSAAQNGIEALFSLERTVGGHHLTLALNGAWQQHRLRTEEGRTVAVPGVPEWTSGALARMLFRWKSLLEVGMRTTSTIPLTTLGLQRANAYTVMHLRAEHPFGLGRLGLLAFLRAENLLDARYTSFLQLNDLGGRYYNPAPGQAFYVGLTFLFHHAAEAPSGD
ncbi:MAG TPA: TonB-dependent receptor [Flavobacteriales bacterium]